MNYAELITLIAVAFIPGALWLLFYYKKDAHPEPSKPVLKVFFLGMLITIPVVLIELGIDYFTGYSGFATLPALLIGTFLIIAPVEELAKYIVVKRTVFLEKIFDEPIDGVIYCVAAALGFATMENVLAALSEGGGIIILRALTATLLHALAGGFIGYHMGIAKFKPHKQKQLLAQGVIIAIIFHGLYNFIIASDTVYMFPLIFILLGIMYTVLSIGISKMKADQIAQDMRKEMTEKAYLKFRGIRDGK